MFKAKGFVLGCVLLALLNFALIRETKAAGDHVIDFIEHINANQGKISQGRIVSGWDALPGQHPHQVSLRHVGRDGSVSGCGGALVHRFWVLTAAHCTARHVSIVVRAGVTSMSTPEYISETTTFYNYPMYDWSRPSDVQPNDIALIRLRHPVVYSRLAKPIRIQPRADAFRDYSGELAYTSGFGRTWTDGSSPQVLQWVFLTMVSNKECSAHFGSVITPNSICAGPFNVTSQSVCQGDSGGPLVHIGEDGVPTLVGITSFVIGGEYGCHSGYPGAFIRPGPFLSWFREVTGLDFEKLEEEEEEIIEESTTEEPGTESPITTEDTPVVTTEETKPEESNEEDDDSPEEDSSQEDPEHEKDSTEEDPSEEVSSEEDPELQELLKRLEVQVKVKVKMNKFKKRHEVHIKHPKRKTMNKGL